MDPILRAQTNGRPPFNARAWRVSILCFCYCRCVGFVPTFYHPVLITVSPILILRRHRTLPLDTVLVLFWRFHRFDEQR